MKILSWNVERLKTQQKEKSNFIKDLINAENPDIIYLTETNLNLDFGDEYFSLHSTALSNFHDNQDYTNQENRTSIFSKYPFIQIFQTYDHHTAICGKISTEFGDLYLYGSIIRSFGGKDIYFENDLKNQKDDLMKLSGTICYSGDFNISFSGFKYPSKKVIEETNQFFKTMEMKILTEENENCAIHIVLNKNFIEGKKTSTRMIEIPGKISDHNAVISEIMENLEPTTY
ncbi:endonuclease/exonuclease/phosphatase family protein [Kaistella jeonii]|uniref:Uncharacterized protein n=1 Tax=Kaistella jeonii TaxID=266749 RepID=A0A0C1F683_9FLAO|nr:endonuclease/exonuclease/phosphatase family protein [Kaistella jeonii]KIA88687.1 hypothetical protein OA86_09975 [Kaistella jeonii]SFC10121.1 Endonuclease/Exonuclease/phosphatase family protein [Kaistella jeonii]VEI95261.1 Uncharacterized protein conserved in bacteria [Kaistella jeonii]